MIFRLIVICSLSTLALAAPNEKLVKKQISCGGDYTINAGEQRIVTSPNYPSFYGNYENCKWIIRTNAGNTLYMYFLHFDTENSWDKLKIEDGPVAMGLYSGSTVPPNFTSVYNTLTLEFTSDGSVTRQGFEIIISVTGGSGSGDPHMVTFDGRRYSLQGVCWYTFFKDCSADSEFEVTAKFEPRPDTEVFKTRTVSFKVTVGDQYAIVNGHDVATGNTRDDHVGSSAIQIQEEDHVITVTFTSKGTTFTLIWRMKTHALQTSFSGTDYNGKLCGLLGNADGDKRNDLQKPDGTIVNDAIEFGESWKVSGEVCE